MNQFYLFFEVLISLFIVLNGQTLYTTSNKENFNLYTKSSSNHVTQHQQNFQDSNCSVLPINNFLHNKIEKLLNVEKVTLIEYYLSLANYSVELNPLKKNIIKSYKLHKWSRVKTAHGQTLLGLAFNYGVLSIETLTIGTTTLDVQLYDNPFGCFGNIDSEQDKINLLRDLLMTDFSPNEKNIFINEERICHEIVESDNEGYANFKDRCYAIDENTKKIITEDGYYNFWLSLLQFLLILVKSLLFLFGPFLFLSVVLSMSIDSRPYVVKLKESLTKTIVLYYNDPPKENGIKGRRYIDLRRLKGFPKLRECSKSVNPGVVTKVKFTQYDINVDYNRTLTENFVPVGLFENLYESIFRCRVRNVNPFQTCCYQDALFMCHSKSCTKNDNKRRRKYLWIKCCKNVSRFMSIFLIPIPYYIRLFLFYYSEYEEVISEKNIIKMLGLKEKFENSLIQYLLPTHPFFILIYLCYLIAALCIALRPRKQKDGGRLVKIFVQSFRDMQHLEWSRILSIVVSNFIWPFKNFGCFGILIGFIYWPIVMPLSFILASIYIIPISYLTIRIIIHSKNAIYEKTRYRKENKPYQSNIKIDQDFANFEFNLILSKHFTRTKKWIDNIINPEEENDNCNNNNNKNGSSSTIENDDDNNESKDVEVVEMEQSNINKLKEAVSLESNVFYYTKTKFKRCLFYSFTSILMLATLYSIVIITAELIGCVVELLVFTIMGIIVNAATLLKYVMLLLMVFGYSCDCFNNVAKKYLKLNKALFTDIKDRIKKDINEVTSLPSNLQENRGFKSQELNEQAYYETPDDIAVKPKNHWMINDLEMFVDNQDMPRIPKQLFKDVCGIKVAGVPGPIINGHLEALTQFFKILLFILFVFIIVLTFGAVYNVSPTNQLLATMVGGFLPLVLKTFLAPPSPDIELSTVSFKSKMEEVIKNFYQFWPIYDLPFEIVKEITGNIDIIESDCNGKSTNITNVIDTMSHSHTKETFLGDNQLYDDYEAELVINSTALLKPDSNSKQSPSDEYKKNQKDKLAKSYKKSVTINIDSEPDVDLVIYMPERFDENWLDEWSDLMAEGVIDCKN